MGALLGTFMCGSRMIFLKKTVDNVTSEVCLVLKWLCLFHSWGTLPKVQVPRLSESWWDQEVAVGHEK